MNKTIHYITYQTFPANTANSIQSISNIKYLIRKGVNVKLFFPKREKQSSDDISVLQNHYDFKEEFHARGIATVAYGVARSGVRKWNFGAADKPSTELLAVLTKAAERLERPPRSAPSKCLRPQKRQRPSAARRVRPSKWAPGSRP